MRGSEESQSRQMSQAIDILINNNIKMCTTCDSLKFFAFKKGSSTTTTLEYLTVSVNCVGNLTFTAPTGSSSGRPGNNQLFIATLLLD